MIKPVRTIGDAMLQVKVPLPFPLRWVNGYAVRSRTGWTLIDPGLHTAEAEELWTRTMDEWDLPLGALEQIVLTHHHPDHYGMSGWFQERTGVPVRISALGAEQIRALWGEGEPMSARLIELFRRHGMDEATLAGMADHMAGFIPQVSPQPKLTTIEPDRSVRIGDRDYRPIVAPGHAAGQLLFYDEERREIICGDHVLPSITPNVGLLPGFDDNPLRSYIDSLKQVSRLQVEMAYPGHRDPFASFSDRAIEIVRHHEERLGAMEAKLREPMTSYALCLAIFGDRLSIHQLRFALSETIAHLVYLREQGRVRETERDGIFYYSV